MDVILKMSNTQVSSEKVEEVVSLEVPGMHFIKWKRKDAHVYDLAKESPGTSSENSVNGIHHKEKEIGN